MTVITPTVGRIVWYWGPGTSPLVHGCQPQAAIVTYVHSDRLINISAFTHDGMPIARTSVDLRQEGDTRPVNGNYAEWMPYQLGQAKKHAPEAAAA